jgi:tetratricopeptide (TPR) repeat protein
MNILGFRFSKWQTKAKSQEQWRQGDTETRRRGEVAPSPRPRVPSVALCSMLLCLVFVLHFGCGTDPEEEERTSTLEEDVQNGWAQYRSGNYGAAILAFERALTQSEAFAVEPSYLADAYNGLGWAYLGFSRSAGLANQKNIATSLGKFQEAIIHDETNADAWVGKAGLLLIRRNSQDDLREALKAVDSALQGDAEYLYRHDYDSEADLYTLRAQCYYYLGELDKAQDEVKRALAIEKGNSVALILKGLL